MQGEARRGTTGVLLRRPCVAVRMRERSSVHSSHGRRGHRQRAARAAREGGPCATGQRMQADWPSSHVLRVRRAHHVSCCTAFPRLLLLHYLAPSTDRVPHVENGIQLGMGVFFWVWKPNPVQTRCKLCLPLSAARSPPKPPNPSPSSGDTNHGLPLRQARALPRICQVELGWPIAPGGSPPRMTHGRDADLASLLHVAFPLHRRPRRAIPDPEADRCLNERGALRRSRAPMVERELSGYMPFGKVGVFTSPCVAQFKKKSH